MTTMSELKAWFDTGVEEKATHMIVACDTFDYVDYPVYVTLGEDFFVQYDAHNGKNMQHIMEVYDLSKPWVSNSGIVMELPERPAATDLGESTPA